MPVDRREENLKVANEADKIQDQSLAAIDRIKKTTYETEAVGVETLEELRKQARQIDDLNADVADINTKLDKSIALQTTFDSWAGNWLGGKKKKAYKDAEREIQNAHEKSLMKVKEVFEQQNYKKLTRTWGDSKLVLCSNTTVSADQIFNPAIQSADSNWSVDYTMTNIDPEGWTYGYDFNTLDKSPTSGDSTMKWNSYVRRRKWKYSEKSLVSDVTSAIQDRNNARKLKANQSTSMQGEKIGYIPRSKLSQLNASGLTSNGSSHSGPRASEEDMDDESKQALGKINQKDKLIDEGLDEIDKTLSRINNLAVNMNEVTKESNSNIDTLSNNMQHVNDKTVVVNSRLKFQLK